jgi:hypothetical protein
MEHVVEIVMPMFKKYKYKQYFPSVSEYRASMIVSNIIYFELFCLLIPEQINCDPLNIM